MLLNVIFQKLIFDAVVADSALKPQQEKL